MRIPGVKRAKLYASRVMAPLQARVAILLYHRIFHSQSDFWGICVSPEKFREHLEYLQRNHTVISLTELMQGLTANRLPKRAVVLTFDDGYVDNLMEAKPLLDRYNTPATVYVSTGSLDSNKEFWWDELEKLVLLSPVLPPRLELTLEKQTRGWEINSASSSVGFSNGLLSYKGRPPEQEQQIRKEVYISLHRLIKPLTQHERDGAMDQLWAQVGIRQQPRRNYRVLAPEEIRQLCDGKLVEIGAHSVTHPFLPSQKPVTQKWEMMESKRKLEEIVEAPVKSFAYPYGGMDRCSTQIADELGFQSACSTVRKTVTHGTHHFALPRFTVENWDGEDFGRRLLTFFWR